MWFKYKYDIFNYIYNDHFIIDHVYKAKWFYSLYYGYTYLNIDKFEINIKIPYLSIGKAYIFKNKFDKNKIVDKNSLILCFREVSEPIHIKRKTIINEVI